VGRRGGEGSVLEEGTFSSDSPGNRAGNSEDDEEDDLAEGRGYTSKDALQLRHKELKTKERYHKSESKRMKAALKRHDDASKRLLAQADELLQTGYGILGRRRRTNWIQAMQTAWTNSAKKSCGLNEDDYKPTKAGGRHYCMFTSSPIFRRYLAYKRKSELAEFLIKADADTSRGVIAVSYSPKNPRSSTAPCAGTQQTCAVTYKWQQGKDEDKAACEVKKTIACAFEKDSCKTCTGQRRRVSFDKYSVDKGGEHKLVCSVKLEALHEKEKDATCFAVAQLCRL